MEKRSRSHPLLADDLKLRQRFDADPAVARDRALARSAALMLIKYDSESRTRERARR